MRSTGGTIPRAHHINHGTCGVHNKHVTYQLSLTEARAVAFCWADDLTAHACAAAAMAGQLVPICQTRNKEMLHADALLACLGQRDLPARSSTHPGHP
jgi:hypothetical protein